VRPLPPTALVLTAGRGTRLEPLSFVRAKPAVPVAGIPLVRRIIRWLVAFDVTDIILNLHHRPETITRVVGDGHDLGARVRYSWEPQLLGSGGGPRRALPLFDTERCLIVNGDTLTDVDLHAMADVHARTSASVTMALVLNPDPWWYGGVVLDDASRITTFTTSLRRQQASGEQRPSTFRQAQGRPERSRGTTSSGRPEPLEGRTTSSELYHFVGVQIVERDVFASLTEGEPAESVSGLYRRLIAEGRRVVQGFTCEAPFHDIGTPADYLQTSLQFSHAEGHGENIPHGTGTSIASDARVKRTAVWDGVSIGGGSELVDCIVTDRVEIPRGTCLERGVLIAQNDCAPVEGGRIIGNARMFPLSEDVR
jgi:mannose-1-phosphate guanylyltransferase